MPPAPPPPESDPFPAQVDALLAHADADGPDALRARLAAARMLAERGDLPRARAVADRALDLAQGLGRASAAELLGDLAQAEGDAAAARTAFHEALRIGREALNAAPADIAAARSFARAKGRLADLDAAESRDARPGAEAALALLQAVAAQAGESPDLAADIADAHVRLARLDLAREGADEARRRLGHAIGRYEALCIAEKEEPHWRAQLAEAWTLDAEAALLCRLPDQARSAMDKALTLRVRLARDDADERWALAGAWRVRAALMASLGDAPAALESQAQARGLVELMASEMPQAFARTRFLHRVLIEEADLALRFGDVARARDCADDARRRLEPFVQAGDATWRGELAAAWDRLGEAARAANAPDKSQDAFERAAEFRRLIVESAPSNGAEIRRLAGALTKLGDSALAADAPQSARAAFQESLALRLALAEAAPGDAAPARDLAVALERVGLAAQAMGDRDGARHAWEEELALIERVFEGDESPESESFRAMIEGHLAGLGGVDSAARRASALARLDVLAQRGQLTPRDIALRTKLWKQT